MHDRRMCSLVRGVVDKYGQNHEGEIRIGLEKKLDALVLRELYGKSKTALTEEEREKARQEYLDRRGIPNSFRW